MAMSADPDAVYQQAVRKLRLLLSASEAMSSLEASEMSDGGEGSALPLMHNTGEGFLSDPRPSVAASGGAQRYLRRGQQSKARRGLFREASGASSAGLASRDRHNSWHNLTHVGVGGSGDDAGQQGRGDRERVEELALLAKQEGYIKQLEKETTFCR